MSEVLVAEENFFPQKFVYDFYHHHRHLERYFNAIKFLGRLGRDETWLDCACGSGYGTSILSMYTNRVVGHDISESAIEHARENHGSSKCDFVENFPKDTKFDAVMSIETIEHMSRKEAPEFLANIYNVMTSGAEMVISTPIVPISDPSPQNEFHLYEYSRGEFMSLLLGSGFYVVDETYEESLFTDGIRKKQGMFKCKKAI